MLSVKDSHIDPFSDADFNIILKESDHIHNLAMCFRPDPGQPNFPRDPAPSLVNLYVNFSRKYEDESQIEQITDALPQAPSLRNLELYDISAPLDARCGRAISIFNLALRHINSRYQRSCFALSHSKRISCGSKSPPEPGSPFYYVSHWPILQSHQICHQPGFRVYNIFAPESDIGGHPVAFSSSAS